MHSKDNILIAEKYNTVLRYKLISESARYRVFSNETYDQLKTLSGSIKLVARPSRPLKVNEPYGHPPNRYDPDWDYVLTDGRNYLHVYFDNSGYVTEVARFGRNRVHQFLELFKDIVNLDDPEDEDLDQTLF